MPFDLAGLRVERKHRAGIEVVARTHRRIERAGVADAPINRVQLGVIGAGDPGRSATELPGVALPGVSAGLVGAGYRMGPPQVLASLRVPAIDEAAYAVLGARDAGDDDAVGNQRRDRHRIAFLDVGGLLAPEFLAGLGIERDYVGVQRGAEQLSIEQRGAAVDDAAASNTRRLAGYSTLVFQICLPVLASTAIVALWVVT